MRDDLKQQKDYPAADPTTEILTETANEYVTGLIKQEGLYVGLGLGAVVGGLLMTRDIGTTLRRASELIGLVQSLAANLPAAAGELSE